MSFWESLVTRKQQATEDVAGTATSGTTEGDFSSDQKGFFDLLTRTASQAKEGLGSFTDKGEAWTGWAKKQWTLYNKDVWRESGESIEDILVDLIEYVNMNSSSLLEGKKGLVFQTKTLRETIAHLKRAFRHDVDNEEDPDTKKYMKDLQGLAAFFHKLPDLHIEGSLEEPTECNLEIFGSLQTLRMSGMEVLFVKGGHTVHTLTCVDDTSLPSTPCFPGLTTLRLHDTPCEPILKHLCSCPTGLVMDKSLTSIEKFHEITTQSAVLQDISFKLKSLSVPNNEISQIPPETANLKLELFDVSHNRVSSLNVLEGMKELKELMASHNLLAHVSFMDGTLSHLQRLDLSHNQLHSVEGLTKLLSLEFLDLSNNFIDDMKEVNKLANLENLMSLSLQGNPLARNSSDYRSMVLLVFRSRLENCTYTQPAVFELDGTRPTMREIKRMLKDYDVAHTFPDAIDQTASPLSSSPPPPMPIENGIIDEKVELGRMDSHRKKGKKKSKAKMAISTGPDLDTNVNSDASLLDPADAMAIHFTSGNMEYGRECGYQDADTQCSMLPKDAEYAHQLLLDVLQRRLSCYEELSHTQFEDDLVAFFKDGVALHCLVHSIAPSLLNGLEFDRRTPQRNLETVLHVAQQRMGASQNISAKDLQNKATLQAYLQALVTKWAETSEEIDRDTDAEIDLLKKRIDTLRQQRFHDKLRIKVLKHEVSLLKEEVTGQVSSSSALLPALKAMPMDSERFLPSVVMMMASPTEGISMEKHGSRMSFRGQDLLDWVRDHVVLQRPKPKVESCDKDSHRIALDLLRGGWIRKMHTKPELNGQEDVSSPEMRRIFASAWYQIVPRTGQRLPTHTAMEDVILRMKGASGLPIKMHVIGTHTYEACFSGSACLEWILSHVDVSGYHDALALAERLVGRGLIRVKRVAHDDGRHDVQGQRDGQDGLKAFHDSPSKLYTYT